MGQQLFSHQHLQHRAAFTTGATPGLLHFQEPGYQPHGKYKFFLQAEVLRQARESDTKLTFLIETTEKNSKIQIPLWDRENMPNQCYGQMTLSTNEIQLMHLQCWLKAATGCCVFHWFPFLLQLHNGLNVFVSSIFHAQSALHRCSVWFVHARGAGLSLGGAGQLVAAVGVGLYKITSFLECYFDNPVLPTVGKLHFGTWGHL